MNKKTHARRPLGSNPLPPPPPSRCRKISRVLNPRPPDLAPPLPPRSPLALCVGSPSTPPPLPPASRIGGGIARGHNKSFKIGGPSLEGASGQRRGEVDLLKLGSSVPLACGSGRGGDAKTDFFHGLRLAVDPLLFGTLYPALNQFHFFFSLIVVIPLA